MLTAFSRKGRRGMMALACVTLLFVLAGCGGGNTTSTPTPTPSSMELTTVNLGIPQEALNSPVTGTLPATTPLHVSVGFRINQAYLNGLDPQKASSENTTDLQTVANQIGITDQQYAQIKQFFGLENARLTLNKLHTTLMIDAPASTFSDLLHVQFVYHQYQGHQFFAPDKPVQVPTSIAGSISAITGLDSYTRPPTHHAFRQPASPNSVSKQAAACFQTGEPNDPPATVRASYSLGSYYNRHLTGQKTTVILLEFAPFSVNDVAPYLRCVGYRGQLTTITVNNDPPKADPNADIEPTLDIDMIAGLAPDANIVVYQAANGEGMHVLLNQIIEDNTKFTGLKTVSISWGMSEAWETASDMQQVAQDIQVLTKIEHMTVFAAAGDCGAYDTGQYPDTPTVDFPGTAPYTVSVSGTELFPSRTGTRANETSWTMDKQADPHKCQNDWGGGGGQSVYFRMPDWQSKNGATLNNPQGVRQVPDIAAASIWLPIFYQGQWYDIGGTSAATPIWATIDLLLNQALAQRTRYFVFGASPFYVAWSHSNQGQAFYDVVKGNNRYYQAGRGWDYCTGLGAPNLPVLEQTLVNLLH